jgi:hypothetical protein
MRCGRVVTSLKDGPSSRPTRITWQCRHYATREMRRMHHPLSGGAISEGVMTG